MFPTLYQEIIYKRTYARWDYTLKRREEFRESVHRYITAMSKSIINRNFSTEATGYILTELAKAETMINKLGIMGSMRAMWTAGPPLEKENACAFNCAYTPIESLKDFADVFYLLLCGCGVSYSCERQVIATLPTIKPLVRTPEIEIQFEDSKEGWAQGYLDFIEFLADGIIPTFDLTRIRPKGSILKTFGGRASGPEPLKNLLMFTIRIFQKAQGRKLNSSEVSDLVCKIADTVVVGGIRRSATLALTNPSDRRMAEFKKGDWWIDHGHRALVNVSSCYTEKPDPILFLEDMVHLIESKSGERGIVNRESMASDMIEQGRGEIGTYSVNTCGVNPLIHLAA